MTDVMAADAYPATVPSAIPDTVAVRVSDRRATVASQALPRAVPPAPKPASPKPDAPRKRHLHLVGEHSRLRVAPEHRTRWLLAAASGLLVLVAFGLVYLHVIAAQRQLTLDRLENQVTQQETSYQRLRLQVAELNAPSRIISFAEGTLGMQEPNSTTWLHSVGAATVAPTNALPTQAPTGDDDWPFIKKLMAGTL